MSAAQSTMRKWRGESSIHGSRARGRVETTGKTAKYLRTVKARLGCSRGDSPVNGMAVTWRKKASVSRRHRAEATRICDAVAETVRSAGGEMRRRAKKAATAKAPVRRRTEVRVARENSVAAWRCGGLPWMMRKSQRPRWFPEET